MVEFIPFRGEVVVAVDAKSGIQALDRTQPLLPIDFGKTQKRTFDYARMGTMDLYAAMDVRTGRSSRHCHRLTRHRIRRRAAGSLSLPAAGQLVHCEPTQQQVPVVGGSEEET